MRNNFTEFKDIKVCDFFMDEVRQNLFIKVDLEYSAFLEATNAILVRGADEVGSEWTFSEDEKVELVIVDLRIPFQKPLSDIARQQNFLASIGIPFFMRFAGKSSQSIWVKCSDGLYNVHNYDAAGKFTSAYEGVKDR